MSILTNVELITMIRAFLGYNTTIPCISQVTEELLSGFQYGSASALFGPGGLCWHEMRQWF